MIKRKPEKSIITKELVIVDGVKTMTHISNGIGYHNFIDTGLKFYGHKVFEGWMFLDDKEHRLFKGYFYIDKAEYLDTRKGSKKLCVNNGKTFTSFTKSTKHSWKQWFEIMSNDNEVCTGNKLKEKIPS